MRVGIKYCGGCNPRYDRAAYVRRLARAHRDVWFEQAVPGVQYDRILMVCGCPAGCVRPDGLLCGQILYICREDQSWEDIPAGTRR